MGQDKLCGPIEVFTVCAHLRVWLQSYAESAWKDAECVWEHTVNPGALLSSIAFLFAQQLFHPSQWPLHSAAVFFLGGLVSPDQIRFLLRVNFLSRQLITPPNSIRFDMLEF